MAAANKLNQNDDVLKALSASPQPLSAYGILKALQLDGQGRIKAPVQVYRSVEKLISRKLVHRIESLNAYIVCDHPYHESDPGFFRCRHCGSVTEFNLSQVIDPHRCVSGKFHIETMSVEIEGTCQACQAAREFTA